MPQDDLTNLESKLRRSLMPVALSESATDSIHNLIDELAGTTAAVPRVIPADATISRKPTPWRSAAAAVAGLLAVSAWLGSSRIEQLAYSANQDGLPGPIASAETMHLVDESTRLAWVEDEGWLDDPDGGSLRAVRMRVVEENRLLDTETGIIVHVASPREEMLLMPVSTF